MEISDAIKATSTFQHPGMQRLSVDKYSPIRAALGICSDLDAMLLPSSESAVFSQVPLFLREAAQRILFFSSNSNLNRTWNTNSLAISEQGSDFLWRTQEKLRKSGHQPGLAVLLAHSIALPLSTVARCTPNISYVPFTNQSPVWHSATARKLPLRLSSSGSPYAIIKPFHYKWLEPASPKEKPYQPLELFTTSLLRHRGKEHVGNMKARRLCKAIRNLESEYWIDKRALPAVMPLAYQLKPFCGNLRVGKSATRNDDCKQLLYRLSIIKFRHFYSKHVSQYATQDTAIDLVYAVDGSGHIVYINLIEHAVAMPLASNYEPPFTEEHLLNQWLKHQ